MSRVRAAARPVPTGATVARANPATAHRSVRLAHPAAALLGLQRTAGNRAVQRMLAPGLRVSRPGDASERRADQIAAVGRGRRAERAAGRGDRLVRRPGRPLAGPVRARLEPTLGADLGDVRVHLGPDAQAATAALGATAVTVGRHVLFAAGAYAPGTGQGDRVLAHELGHVVDGGGSAACDTAHRQVAETEPAPASISGVVIPDGFTAGPGQMRESDFLERARVVLNAAGLRVLEQAGETVPLLDMGLGDVYVANIAAESAATGQSIESIVSDTIQGSEATADGYLLGLESAVPAAFERNRAAFNQMRRSYAEQAALASGISEEDIRRFGMGGAAQTTATAPPSGQTQAGILAEFPEITSTLAAALVHIPMSIWGPLRPLLQGLIFHSIISAGYLAGYPQPAHPLALINRGGGALGRKRTDLRDPATFAVIEIKPQGDGGGALQLATYVATLQAEGPWHEARNVPTEAWPATGAQARYTLNPFGINVTLVAEQRFATEPGMLYYRLDTTPGLPVYIPVHAQRPERRFNFEFPRIRIPDLAVPAPTPQATATVGTMMIMLIAATLIPVVPPPP